jgi:drug/metabolite transporter (DMT)-like permease
VIAARARGPALGVVAALAAVYVVWGSTYLGIALAIETLPPLLMAGARFVVAGAVLYAVARRLDRSGAPRPDRRQWAMALVTGTLLLAIGNGGVSWAEQTVPTGVAALVIATIPLWVVVLDRLFFGARLTWRAVLGIAVGFAGVAVLVNPSAPGGVDPTGGLVLVLAAMGWALGTLLSRGQTLTAPPLVAAGMQMLAGGVLLLIAGVASGELADLHLADVSGRSIFGLVYLILFGSLLAFSAYVWVLRNARTSLVATYAYVNPVVAVALGWLVLDEGVGPRMLAAGAIIVGSVALIVSAPAAPERPARAGSTPAAPPRTAGRSRAAWATRGR